MRDKKGKVKGVKGLNLPDDDEHRTENTNEQQHSEEEGDVVDGTVRSRRRARGQFSRVDARLNGTQQDCADEDGDENADHDTREALTRLFLVEKRVEFHFFSG